MTEAAYQIDFQDEYGVENFPAVRIEAAICGVLAAHDIEAGAALSFVITSDEHVQSLNRQFRGVDAPTDILSFPAEPLPEEIDEDEGYLGDLIMAYPYTLAHAVEAGHALDDELVLLAIHGTLHLLGYDHDNAANQDDMWAAQSEALVSAGVSIVVPRFTFETNEVNSDD